MNLTDNEIIKALECCSKGFGNCEGCPYDDDNADCVTLKGETLMMKDALDLINRQKAEIERLAKENIGLRYDLQVASEESLTAQAEAIKEFAERLKKSTFDCDVSLGYGKGCYVKAVTTIEIDNLVKEMVGG